MALLEGNLFSAVLGRQVSYTVVMPHDVCEEPAWGYPVLYLLHARGDDRHSWLTRSNIERYASERGIVVVMPDCGSGIYCDAKFGEKQLTFIIEELPEKLGRMLRLSYTRENTFIGGVSMGGYGAIKCALLSPERFSGCIAISPVTEISAYVQYTADRGELPMWQGVFGNDLAIPRDDDLYILAENISSFIHISPKIYIACGKKDELYAQNIRFKNHLDSRHVDFTFEQAQADHEWSFWDVAIQYGMNAIIPSAR